MDVISRLLLVLYMVSLSSKASMALGPGYMPVWLLNAAKCIMFFCFLNVGIE